MDNLLSKLNATVDGDLAICDRIGVAYERDMKTRVRYDAQYLQKVARYRDSDIAKRVNAGRVELLKRHASISDRVLDYGCGDGAFIDAATEAGFVVHGDDINVIMRKRLRALGQLAKAISNYRVVCMWDVLEHLESPDLFFREIAPDALLFVSLPIFDDLKNIRQSKHYRPGEHHYYFTHAGLLEYMAMHSFRFVAMSDHEMEAGRENIAAAVFQKQQHARDYFVMQYHDLHLQKYYGSSAVELHFDIAWDWVKRTNAKSILDYGCGRSDLAAHFWNDGKRVIKRYDPAIREYRNFPNETFDLVFVLDVMEHIPIGGVDYALTQIAKVGTSALFAISMKPARQRLPDGTNAHCTLLSEGEWLRWLKSHFKRVAKLPTQWEHELIVIASHKATL